MTLRALAPASRASSSRAGACRRGDTGEETADTVNADPQGQAMVKLGRRGPEGQGDIAAEAIAPPEAGGEESLRISDGPPVPRLIEEPVRPASRRANIARVDPGVGMRQPPGGLAIGHACPQTLGDGGGGGRGGIAAARASAGVQRGTACHLPSSERTPILPACSSSPRRMPLRSAPPSIGKAGYSDPKVTAERVYLWRSSSPSSAGTAPCRATRSSPPTASPRPSCSRWPAAFPSQRCSPPAPRHHAELHRRERPAHRREGSKLGLTPDQLKKLGGGMPAMLALLNSAPIEDVKAWAAAQFLSSNVAVLPTDIDDANFDFYGKLLQGRTEQRQRWQRGSTSSRVDGRGRSARFTSRALPALEQGGDGEVGRQLAHRARRATSRTSPG